MNGEETEGSGDVEEKNCFDPLKVDPLKYLDMFLHLIQLRIPDFFYDKKNVPPLNFFPFQYWHELAKTWWMWQQYLLEGVTQGGCKLNHFGASSLWNSYWL